MSIISLDRSWLVGKYPAIGAEINTSMPYVSFRDFFAQGDDADKIIGEIHTYWINNDCSVEDAIKHWINSYLD